MPQDAQQNNRSLTEAQKTILRIVVIVLVVGIIFVFGSVSCPFEAIFGIPCAGCGMTRAWQEALQLNFDAAFSYHPLFWTIPFIVVFGLCQPLINRKVFWTIAFFIALLFIVVWLFRFFLL